MRNAQFLVILDTMWGSPSLETPRWFTINPFNLSGKRLYALTQSRYGQVWVTNACPQRVGHATTHGTPDVAWLAANLDALPAPTHTLPLLVCGKVAEKTFRLLASGLTHVPYKHAGPVIFLPHPAARNWSHARVQSFTNKIACVVRRARKS